VLSTSGHIASLVNPPSNPKSTWRVADSTPADAEEWLAAATTEKGSWWTDHVAWLAQRSGEQVDPPAELAAGLEPLGDAPGTYVFDR
jgi:polyhydroxyalkanoate synthase